MLSEKAKLYRCADQLRSRFFVAIDQPVYTIDLLSGCPHIAVEYYHFKTPGLCGIAMVGEKVDTIALNLNRDQMEQNFDCAHELLQLYTNRNLQDSFKCFTKAKSQQNSFWEWRANEGAAQFLVPYQDFIPRVSLYL